MPCWCVSASAASILSQIETAAGNVCTVIPEKNDPRGGVGGGVGGRRKHRGRKHFLATHATLASRCRAPWRLHSRSDWPVRGSGMSARSGSSTTLLGCEIRRPVTKRNGDIPVPLTIGPTRYACLRDLGCGLGGSAVNIRDRVKGSSEAYPRALGRARAERRTDRENSLLNPKTLTDKTRA